MKAILKFKPLFIVLAFMTIAMSSCNKANEHSWPVLDIKYALNDGKDVALQWLTSIYDKAKTDETNQIAKIQN